MPVGNLGAGSRASQVYNASGEATEQAPLPKEYVASPVATSPLSGHLSIPTDHTSFVPGQPNAVVRRWPRMNGMRYLYASGLSRIPIQHTGGNGIPYPWISSFNRFSHGPIHDAGFNDALYQAGYPGFNLGLSFKVPTTPDESVTRVSMKNVQTYRTNALQRGAKLIRNRRVTGAFGTDA